MDEKDYKSLILIAGLDKFYNTMNTLCVEAISKFGSSNFRFLNGISLILGNRLQEGIRELNNLVNDLDVGIGSILALIYGHKKSTMVDKDAVANLEQKIKEERKRINANSAYFASLFLFLCGKYDKAKEYAEKTIKFHSDHTDSLVLKGYCLLQMNQKNRVTLELFERATNISESICATLGQVRYHQQNNDFEKAISILNRLSVKYPQLNMPLVEKMKTYLASWDYEQAFETAYRILNIEPQNIEALRIKTIVMLCRDGKVEESSEVLNTLYKALEKLEPSNSEIYYEIAQLFSRCCGRNIKILAETYRFAEKSNILAPTNSNYLTELGFECILLKQVKNAVKFFRNATKIDDNSIQALCGLTMCQLLDSGYSTQVSQQIEFLSEIQGNNNKSPLLLLLSAKISPDKPKHAISFLVEASEIHFKNLKTLSFGCEYLRIFDPDFLLQLCKELLQYCPIQQSITMKSSMPRESLHISLKNSMNILEAIVKAVPGSCEALYLLARVQFLSGETGSSAMSLQKILQEIDPTFTPAHLLIAQIHIQQNNHQRASQSLEICLSHDFKIRDNSLYHLICGIVQKSQQKYEDCLKSFKMAMTLCGYYNISNADDTSNKSKNNPDKSSLGLADLVSLFLEMINTYILMNETTEASKLMQFAMKEFENTPEAGRVVIANADLYLSQGNVSKSLELLSNIKSGQTYYLQAKTKMAHIYLVNKKDRLSFAQCFKELVHNNPGPDSFIMLGDAYMSIQEPDEAVEAYRQAVLQDPNDPSLAAKLGRAYVKTHQYKKAILYYKDAIMAPENYQLKLDLAELYLKLKQFTNAEQIILEDIETNQRHDDDLGKLQTRTKLLLLLARVREKSGNINSSLSTLKEARDNQHRIQHRLSLDQNANVREQHKILSKICALMAEQSIMIRDTDQAILHYKEAIRYSPQETTQQAALAKLFMQLNRMQECQSMCAVILDNDPSNETAQIMMADLSFRKIDFENAAYHFSQLILNKPTYWTALARLIEVMRRSGCLTDVSTFMERAEESAESQMDAGLNYCKGLYDWYTCNPNAALRFFNNCRRDSEWGKQGVFNMIEICLNPDNDLPSELEINETPEDIDINNSRQIALKTAERLLKELKPKTYNSLDNEALNHKLLENFLLLATRQKANIEKALNNFNSIASQDEFKDNIGVIYGMAACYVMLKQGQRAKNQLKRISKNLWTFEDAEYLERSWLLLADIYIQASKYDIASDLLQKVLKHNKSCSKAYELCGSIAEKEQSYKSAAMHYDQGKVNPNLISS
ncbi:hypothetical protein ACKWTF_008359 [Chironomus riparius]